jgi:hypothetical protein
MLNRHKFTGGINYNVKTLRTVLRQNVRHWSLMVSKFDILQEYAYKVQKTIHDTAKAQRRYKTRKEIAEIEEYQDLNTAYRCELDVALENLEKAEALYKDLGFGEDLASIDISTNKDALIDILKSGVYSDSLINDEEAGFIRGWIELKGRR